MKLLGSSMRSLEICRTNAFCKGTNRVPPLYASCTALVSTGLSRKSWTNLRITQFWKEGISLSWAKLPCLDQDCVGAIHQGAVDEPAQENSQNFVFRAVETSLGRAEICQLLGDTCDQSSLNVEWRVVAGSVDFQGCTIIV